MIASDSLSSKARGGTELMKERLISSVDSSILDQFQIFFSRVEEPLDTTKIRILYLHDLPGDPASNHLKGGGWKKFHQLVFVSNWQMQAFINYYDIPWSKCIVIYNAILPIEQHQKPNDGTIRLGYWSTPHRGLELLVPAFEAIAENRSNVVLDVYSSFELYNWKERDKPFEALFDRCRKHPQINYHGSVSNEDIRESTKQTHIFAYPNIWPETSCLSLIEAMSASCICVHPNFAALAETASDSTFMYQFHEDPSSHASLFANILDSVIENYWSMTTQTTVIKTIADNKFCLETYKIHWNRLLGKLINDYKDIDLGFEREILTFRT